MLFLLKYVLVLARALSLSDKRARQGKSQVRPMEYVLVYGSRKHVRGNFAHPAGRIENHSFKSLVFFSWCFHAENTRLTSTNRELSKVVQLVELCRREVVILSFNARVASWRELYRKSPFRKPCLTSYPSKIAS